MPPRIAWDQAKETANRRKHGVDFREAIEALQDPLALSEPDEQEALDGERWNTIGRTRAGRLLRVTTSESGSTIRIISARRATARERHAYEEDA
jgi:uncharacterized protein